MKPVKAALLAMVFIVAAGGTAYADIVVNAAPTITPVGSDFRWSYTLATDSSELENTALNASFFTLYDVNGLVPNSELYVPLIGSLSGTPNTQLVGPTPEGISAADSPVIPNVFVDFLGTSPTSTDIGVLSFLDNSGTPAADTGQFAGQATNAVNGSRAFNSSFVAVPSAVPEPSSLALLASGMLGLAGMGLRRFRKQ